MFFIKASILTPAIQAELQQTNIDSYTMSHINLLMGMVVGNNYNVWHKAERNCIKK
tara:strand:- start:692 stop:859 length:168 start_codon:yes stop_codon:yes gene_type:complete